MAIDESGIRNSRGQIEKMSDKKLEEIIKDPLCSRFSSKVAKELLTERRLKNLERRLSRLEVAVNAMKKS